MSDRNQSFIFDIDKALDNLEDQIINEECLSATNSNQSQYEISKFSQEVHTKNINEEKENAEITTLNNNNNNHGDDKQISKNEPSFDANKEQKGA
jgi:hypothetical protein